MINKLFNMLERRVPIDSIVADCRDLFERDDSGHACFRARGFDDLCSFLENGTSSFQGPAVQAGVRWAKGSQRVRLRNTILQRGFVSPSCLWAHKQLRGNPEEIFKDYPSPEMCFMQIILLRESAPEVSVPFLINRFITNEDIPEELRTLSRVCMLRVLDSGVSPDQLRSFQSRYPKVEALFQWRPSIPGRTLTPKHGIGENAADFHRIVRSLHDMRELSSLTRTLYLISIFYVPLTNKEWESLLVGRTDHTFFERLRLCGMVEPCNGGSILSTDAAKKRMVKKFLYESYSLAKESVDRSTAERLREERERKVRTSELDRQALSVVPDGIICVDRSGLLYYLNPAAERALKENPELRQRLFGTGSLEKALRNYSPDAVLSRITESMEDDGHNAEVFGDRISLSAGGKRYEVELGPQVVLLRDTTDQSLIDEEIGKLYRHEMKAALDVMGVGLGTARELIQKGRIDEGLGSLHQVDNKREELFSMLEERIDFIRLHSDAFRINPTPVNLNMVVDKCVGNYREAVLAKQVTIASDHLHGPAVNVRGEERFLVRALDNIIRNAVKFTAKGTQVKVSLRGNDREAFVTVEDSGPGISGENLGKIFQLGFTTGGSGRGLYLARRIAAAHGGRIEVKSSPGHGALFTFRLPATTEA